MAKSIIQRLFGRFLDAPPVAPASPNSPDRDVEGDVRSYAETAVAAGFEERDEIVENVTACFEGELPAAALDRLVPGLVDDALADHRMRQQDWPVVTDCDRLDAAFLALEETGIIARQNFTCCGTCGATEIWDEMDAARGEGRPVRGYAFYHVQDTESAAGGDGVYLNYGAVDEGEEASLAVAREIVTTLGRSGLTTDWNGSLNQRIGVSLDWKRRRSD